MSRIRSTPEPRPAPLGKVAVSHPVAIAGWQRDFPLARVFSSGDFFPTNVDADIRALRNWERRRAELLADLPDEGEVF